LFELGPLFFPAFGALGRDVCFTEHLACGILIVRRAEQAEIVDRRGTVERVRATMFDREKTPGAAAPTLVVDVRALRG
jgi:hypothetical protein